MMTQIISTAGAALAVSLVSVAGMRRWAGRARLVDHPNQRSLHDRPTPRGGGVGVVIAVCAALGGAAALQPEVRPAAAVIGGLGFLVAALGLADDAFGLSAPTRLAAHLTAGLLMASGIGAWESLSWPGVGTLALGWVAIPFTVLVIAGLANAYNFMDGIDGIAGGQGVVAGIGWTLLGIHLGDPLLASGGAATAAASAAFLAFNWSPASIFMGDVGSGFLGFILAAFCVVAAEQSPVTATAGLLFVWPFLFDTAFTMGRRAIRRERLFQAHRSHLYQRLVLSGCSHGAVALLYSGLAMTGLAAGLTAVRGSATASLVAAIATGLEAVGLWLWVAWRERGVRTPSAQAGSPVRG